MLRCLRLKLDVKNCLNDGGISLPFFVPNELCDTLRCAKWVEQPLRSAPNNYKKIFFISFLGNLYVKICNLHSPASYRCWKYPSIQEHLVEQENCLNSAMSKKN